MRPPEPPPMVQPSEKPVLQHPFCGLGCPMDESPALLAFFASLRELNSIPRARASAHACARVKSLHLLRFTAEPDKADTPPPPPAPPPPPPPAPPPPRLHRHPRPRHLPPHHRARTPLSDP